MVKSGHFLFKHPCYTCVSLKNLLIYQRCNMDTLTQITLGAAVGEAVLGKKIGNRAMMWGAFGGLLPDLDVAANLFTSEINALAFHRGIMHSAVFALVAAAGLGWLVEWLYASGHFRRRWYKITVFSFIAFLLLVILASINYLLFSSKSGINLHVLAISLGTMVWLSWLLWRKYIRIDWQVLTATRREWFWLFWWSIFTHPLLDCFTSYGTQIFQPFSDYPVAFSSISVVDPMYTLPFIICVLIAASISKHKAPRRIVNWLGIGLSSAYLLFTLYHKYEADQIFKQALAKEGIVYSRFTTSPTLLNNFLWQGVAEGDSAFYHSSFTLLGEEPYIRQFNVLSKGHEWIKPYQNDHTVKILQWFTRGYYSVLKLSDNKFQLNDLRYGSTEENFTDEEKYVFRFILEDSGGNLKAHQLRAYHRISWEGLKELFERIKGGPVSMKR